MAHFAQLDSNNIVQQIIVVGNEQCLDSNGNESEQVGIQFCQQLFGVHTTWVQTSYNSRTRGKYACVGDTYDPQLDAFIAPQPYPSWTLNTITCQWEAPVARPDDGNPYLWDEETTSWISPPTEPTT